MIGTIGGAGGIVPALRQDEGARPNGTGGEDFFAMIQRAGGRVPARHSTAPSENASPADAGTKLQEALAAFRKEATMTPAERARRDVLEKMDLTEDAIEAMSPEQRKATEDKIAAEVARRLAIAEAANRRG